MSLSKKKGVSLIIEYNSWTKVGEYRTTNNGKISIYNREDDETAEMICLVTKSGRRIVVHRSKREVILMSSDSQGTATRFLQCKRE